MELLDRAGDTTACKKQQQKKESIGDRHFCRIERGREEELLADLRQLLHARLQSRGRLLHLLRELVLEFLEHPGTVVGSGGRR